MMEHWKEDWNFRYSRGIARFIGPTSPYFLRSGHLEKFLFWTIWALTSGMQDVISMAFFVSTATVQRYCWWTNFIKFLRPVDSAQTLLYICSVWRNPKSCRIEFVSINRLSTHVFTDFNVFFDVVSLEVSFRNGAGFIVANPRVPGWTLTMKQ